MSTLIRIRSVCFSYRKSGVVLFFQDIDWKKVELYRFSRILNGKKWSYMVFSGIILKKIWSYVVFPRVILKKNEDTWLFRENVEKNGVIAFFLLLV